MNIVNKSYDVSTHTALLVKFHGSCNLLYTHKLIVKFMKVSTSDSMCLSGSI